MKNQLKILFEFVLITALFICTGTILFKESWGPMVIATVHQIVLVILCLIFSVHLIYKAYIEIFKKEKVVKVDTEIYKRKEIRQTCGSKAQFIIQGISKKMEATIKDYTPTSAGIETNIPLKLFDVLKIVDTQCPIKNKRGVVVREAYDYHKNCYNFGLKLHSQKF